MPSTVVVPGAIQHHGNEHFDVEDSKGLGVDGGVLGLVGVEGRGTIRGSLAGSLGLTSGDLRGLALALEAEGALGVGLSHDERRWSGAGSCARLQSGAGKGDKLSNSDWVGEWRVEQGHAGSTGW